MQTTMVNPATLGRFKFALNDGREIWLTQIIQWQTYGGLLCGYPNRSSNEFHLDAAKEKALEHFGDDYPITVLEPEITAYDYPPSGQRRLFPCEALPAIGSVAVFDSDATSRNEGYNSSATIVWFQSEWGLPSPKIQKQIAALDWDQIASDWSW